MICFELRLQKIKGLCNLTEVYEKEQLRDICKSYGDVLIDLWTAEYILKKKVHNLWFF